VYRCDANRVGFAFSCRHYQREWRVGLTTYRFHGAQCPEEGEQRPYGVCVEEVLKERTADEDGDEPVYACDLVDELLNQLWLVRMKTMPTAYSEQ
jgi:hypothetical protein